MGGAVPKDHVFRVILEKEFRGELFRGTQAERLDFARQLPHLLWCSRLIVLIHMAYEPGRQAHPPEGILPILGSAARFARPANDKHKFRVIEHWFMNLEVAVIVCHYLGFRPATSVFRLSSGKVNRDLVRKRLHDPVEVVVLHGIL